MTKFSTFQSTNLRVHIYEKGFTFIEILIQVTVVFIFVSLVAKAILTFNHSGDPAYMDNDMLQAQASMMQAQEMKRANDLRERELQLQQTKH